MLFNKTDHSFYELTDFVFLRMYKSERYFKRDGCPSVTLFKNVNVVQLLNDCEYS